jgi:hypothetical protein
MPDFTYTGSDERYYPSLSLLVKPGDSVTLEIAPDDGRFTSAAKSARSALAKLPAPATDTPEVGN